MILLPKYKTIELAKPITHSHIGFSGEWRIKRYNCMGQLNLDTGWHPNLITNLGLDRIAQTEKWRLWNYWCIGSGTTAPAVTDTTIETLLAGSNTTQSTDNANSGAPNYARSTTKAKRFPAGLGTGTINEGTIGETITGTSIWAHFAVSPGVTKAADEVLDVFYKLTMWPPISDVNSTVTIGAVGYDTIARSAGLTVGVADIMTGNWLGESTLFASSWLAYDGDLGLITSWPSGASANSNTNGVNVSYTPGSHTREMYMDIGLNEWNHVGGFRSTRTQTTEGTVQTQFNATSGGGKVPKDETMIMDNMRWSLSWAVHP